MTEVKRKNLFHNKNAGCLFCGAGDSMYIDACREWRDGGVFISIQMMCGKCNQKRGLRWKELERMRRLVCNRCSKSVSSPVPGDTVVRAWVECPECIERVSDDIVNAWFVYPLFYNVENGEVLELSWAEFRKRLGELGLRVGDEMSQSGGNWNKGD